MENKTNILDPIELKKTWLVTGSCGMDASFLFDLLLEKGYTNIHGTIRRSATSNTKNIDHIFDKLQLHYCDLTDSMNVYSVIQKVFPDYIVHLGALSHVKVGQEMEHYTFCVNTLGTLSILQSVRKLGLEKKCKIYHAGTSEQFGNTSNTTILLNEDSLMKPVSIYGISKKAAQEICDMYRAAYGMFVVSSVLFNHESYRRGQTFVTQKIAQYVARYYKKYIQAKKYNIDVELHHSHPVAAQNILPDFVNPLYLGNINAYRDWGSAEEYVSAIYLMLMQQEPKNYVIATGETHSVREFVATAFKVIDVNIEWFGTGIDEIGIDKDTKRILVRVDQKYYRDIDIDCLIGDASMARKQLGWQPQTGFKELVKIMVESAIKTV